MNKFIKHSIHNFNSTAILLLLIMQISSNDVIAQNINIPNKTGPMDLEVNSLTGNLFFSRNDVFVPARMFNLSITFHYNSFNFDSNKGYGNGWSFIYDIRYMNDTANGKRILWGDGREDSYQFTGSAYKAPAGFFSVLQEYQSGKFSLTETDGTAWFFDNATHKRLTRIQEPNGNFINFNYADTLLTSLTNNAGQTISFAYDSKGRLITVTDAIAAPARSWSYSYDASNNLLQVTDPLGGKYNYNYLINGPVKSVTDKNSNVVDIIYYNDFTVSEMIGCNKRMSFSYDTAQKATVVTDYLESGTNQVTKYFFNSSGGNTWLSGMTSNCCGFDMKFEYDAQGNKIKETDANGNITTYTYDAKGNVLSITDALNQTSTFTYSPDYNKVTSITDPKGFVTTISYDSKGNAVQITEPGNIVYTAAYNSNGEITSSTNPRGQTYTYTYDAYGNPLTVNGPNGFTATFGFDARGNMISFTDPNSNTSNMQYDILSRMKQLTDPLNHNIQVSYDAMDNPTIIKNKNNENSLLKFDASNRMAQFTDAMGKKTTVTYDGMDNIIAITNAAGNTTTFSYDSRNRLSGIKDAEGNLITYNYDANGNIISTHFPNGQQYNYTYDALDRIKTITDATSNLAQIEYDPNDNITKITNATGAVMQFSYDSLNRIRKITDPLGNHVELSYDKNGNVTSFKDRKGSISNIVYDNRDRITGYTDENGAVTTVGYDAAGNVVSLRDANNNTTTYTYDALNRVRRMTYADGSFSEYTYDVKNNVTARRLTNGTIINYSYDTLNRLISKTLPDGQVHTYTYDAIGRLTSATNAAGTVTLTYDVLNRITSESFNGRTVRYNYSISSRTQTTTYPDSSVVTKTFDTRNRLVSIQKNGTAIVSYQYNNANQLISKTFANGVTTNMQYDFANRLTNISTGAFQNISFTYDANGNKTTVTRNNANKSEQFTYDNGNRLTAYREGPAGGPYVINNSYTYDALGNRTTLVSNGITTNYTVNNLNQMLSSNNAVQNINYMYDANGNLSYDGKFYKTYDAEKRLLKDSASPAAVLTYVYDAMGRRVTKNLNGNALNYTYAGFEQIEERNAGGVLLNRTIFNHFLEPVVNEKGNLPFYYHANDLMSVEFLTNAAGILAEQYEYDIYGKQTIYDGAGNPITGSSTGNRFGFTGQVYDSATASNKFFFREYNPATGLFNQRDLIGYGDGMGLYQYVHNNPANGVDVFGLEESWEQILVPTNEPGQGDPCKHDKNKVRYITQNEILREKRQRILDLTDKRNLGNNDKFGAADSRFYTSLNVEQFGGTNYYFEGKVQKNYEVNYFFTAYAQGNDGSFYISAALKTRIWLLGKPLINRSLDLQSVGEGLTSGNRTTNTKKGWIEGQNDIKSGLDIYKDENNSIFPSQNKKTIKNPQFEKFDNMRNEFGEWWPMINPQTKEMSYEFFPYKYVRLGRLLAFQDYIKKYCPENNSGGTQKRPGFIFNPVTGKYEVIASNDPNEIIGPAGEPDKRWVSVKDRLPYTVTYENDKTATAPAKYVKVVVPVHNKMDAASFELKNLGFNSLTFTVPPATASNYQRLDCRDSLGLFVDMTAGYDVINNNFFWEFQSIDPLTLLPPADPLKGFLLRQDSSNSLYGHGFVNFSIKPVIHAQTLDSILAQAFIIFDTNDTIPTNIEKNTIDAVPPTSNMSSLGTNYTGSIPLSWTGADDPGGCGVRFYTLYVSTDGINFSIIRSGITRRDTVFTGNPNVRYYFFVLATDSVGNTETLRPNAIQSTLLGGALPVTWLYFNGKTINKNNVLEWATASEQNTKEFIIERSFNAVNFSKIGTVKAAGNTATNSNYNYTDYDIDRLNQPVMYYRLRQMDLDGRFSYSNIIRLTYNATEKTKTLVYPNPTNGLLTIVVADHKLIGTLARVYDESGKLLQSVKITATAQTINLTSYLGGIYFIVLENKESLKIIKK